MKNYKIIALSFAALLLAGCGTTRITEKSETTVQDKEIKVAVPVVEEVLEARTDTIFVYGEKIVDQDTIIQVKYYPEEKKIYVKVKPDTVKVTLRDTITVTHTTEITNEPNFFEKNFWYLIFIAAAVVIIIAIIKK